MRDWLSLFRKKDAQQVERIVPGTPAWDIGHCEHLQRYEFAAKQMPHGASVLDAGCGVGYGAAHLADHGARNVVGVDIAPDALETARKEFSRGSIVWVRDDCHTLQAVTQHAPFDLICNLENIEHLHSPERFLRRAADLMKKDGLLVVSTPNRTLANKFRGEPSEAPSRNPHHCREYTAREFRELLLGSFRDVELHYQTYTEETRLLLRVEPALSLLWYNPACRVGRSLQRVIRRRPVPKRFEELLTPRQFVITGTDPGEELVLVYVAVCRAPIASR